MGKIAGVIIGILIMAIAVAYGIKLAPKVPG